MGEQDELSGKTIVIFIACGILIFVVFFIFAKRQIVRFALKSRRGPHVPIGHDAPKALFREVDRRVGRVVDIRYEPRVLSKEDESRYTTSTDPQCLPGHYYRMKAADSLFLLEHEIRERQPTLKRHPGDNLRKFLLGLLPGPLQGASSRLVHQFCDCYEHAKHDPADFGPEEYNTFLDLLTQLLQCVSSVPCISLSRPGSAKNSPSTTKRSKKICSDGDAAMTVKYLSNGKQVTFFQRPSSLSVTNGSRTSVMASNETEV